MRIRDLVVHAGLLTTMGLVGACGGGEEGAEPLADEAAAPVPDAAPATAPMATDTGAAAAGGVAAPPGAAAAPAAGGTTAPPAAGGAAAAGGLPAGVTAQMVQQGQQIFNGQGICFSCHGQNGQGGTPLAPALNDNEWLWVQQGPNMYDQIVQTIKTGVSQPKEYQGIMPPNGGAQLSDEQLRAVAAYVYSISQGGGR